MSLYDDLDSIKARTTDKVAGWSSGIKLLQSQLQLKKAAVTQPKREALRRSNQVSLNHLKKKPLSVHCSLVGTYLPFNYLCQRIGMCTSQKWPSSQNFNQKYLLNSNSKYLNQPYCSTKQGGRSVDSQARDPMT